MSTSKFYIILVDALRHDYVTETSSPFLHSLCAGGTKASVVETFAFQTRPAFFAGLEPDQSGISHLFELNHKDSPFSFLKPFNIFLRWLDPWGQRTFGRGIIKRLARLNASRLNQPAAKDVLGTERVPLHLLSNFALSEKIYSDSPYAYGSNRSLFDDLREHSLTWNWIGYPRHFGSTQSILKALKVAPSADVNYLHFSKLDWIGHKFGPDSEQRKKALQELDIELRNLLQEPLNHGSKVFIFGDHGMVKVDYQIDIIAKLKASPLRLGHDYLAFLDSTQARFWFQSETADNEIRAILEHLEGGHILSPSERQELMISDRKFGDIVFALDGPGIIHPSFFSHAKKAPLGMHGYLPKIDENMSLMIAAPAQRQDLGKIKMTELYSLMRDFILN